MGNVLIEETSLDSVGDAIREQLDVSTKYKVSEMPDAIRSISGGGGGTTNYNNLSNKPQINSVTLEGNKSLSDLSIQETLTFDSTPTDGSTNPVTSDGIYDAFAGVDTALSGKVDTTSVGVANGIAELDNDGLVPSSQLPDVAYTDVTNKPSINSVTLSGNKTTADLGLVNNTDLTDIIATGSTNATGNTITSGLYFYLDGVLCKAKSDIANGATFTLNTNYEVVTAGGLNSLNSAIANMGTYSTSEEVEVGTYNGEKLYRRVYESTGTGARNIPITGIKYGKIKKMTAVLNYQNVYTSEPYYTSTSDYWNYYINYNIPAIVFRGAGSAIQNASTLIVVIEYTH